MIKRLFSKFLEWYANWEEDYINIVQHLVVTLIALIIVGSLLGGICKLFLFITSNF